jgi:prepilin peptidase CpaA
MHSIVWWATLTLVLIAAIIDIRCRRIPNWLVVPFLAAGIVMGAGQHGFAGLARSLGGVTLAAVALGAFCRLKATGMGDLKLCVAIGAWIGFTQLAVALVITAMAGAVMAIGWAAFHGAVRESFDGASDLLLNFRARGLRPHPAIRLDHPAALRMPYAPAIAIGAIFSFFCRVSI